MSNLEYHYSVLSLNTSATLEEVKQAYRSLAKILRPDKHCDSSIAKKKFQERHISYQFLMYHLSTKNYKPTQQPTYNKTHTSKTTYDHGEHQSTNHDFKFHSFWESVQKTMHPFLLLSKRATVSIVSMLFATLLVKSVHAVVFPKMKQSALISTFDLNASMQAEAIKINSSTPYMIDEFTKNDRVVYINRTVTYVASFPVIEKSTLNPKQLSSFYTQIKTKLIKSVCNNSVDSRLMNEFEISYRHRFNDKTGLLLCDIIISKSNCMQLASNIKHGT